MKFTEEHIEDVCLGFSEVEKIRNPVKRNQCDKNPFWGQVAAAVIGAYASYRASKKMSEASDRAARLAAEGQEKGIEWQKEMYADFRPYLMRGLKGYQELLEDPQAYKKTPGYQFRLQEGLKAIGIPDGGSKYLSGSQIKAATQYAQDYATGEYGLALQREGGLAGIAGGAAGAGAPYAGGIAGMYMQGAGLQGQYLQSAAAARASGYMGMSRAASQGIQSYQNEQMYEDYMSRTGG